MLVKKTKARREIGLPTQAELGPVHCGAKHRCCICYDENGQPQSDGYATQAVVWSQVMSNEKGPYRGYAHLG